MGSTPTPGRRRDVPVPHLHRGPLHHPRHPHLRRGVRTVRATSTAMTTSAAPTSCATPARPFRRATVVRRTATINDDTATTNNRWAASPRRAPSGKRPTRARASPTQAGLYELRVCVGRFHRDQCLRRGHPRREWSLPRGLRHRAHGGGGQRPGDRHAQQRRRPLCQHRPADALPSLRDRGCTVETSNFDMDAYSGGPGAGGNGSITDVFGTVTALTMSQDGDNSPGPAHSENAITVEPATGVNQDSTNYGVYSLINDTEPSEPHRLARGRLPTWSDADPGPATSVRNPISPIRMYLPNPERLPREPPSPRPRSRCCGPASNGRRPNPPVTGSTTHIRTTRTSTTSSPPACPTARSLPPRSR